MRIGARVPAADQAATNCVNDARSEAASNSAAPVAGELKDTVQPSSGQATVRTLLSQLNQVPDVRQEKVAALQAQVRRGNFQRDSGKVADSILNEFFGPDSRGLSA